MPKLTKAQKTAKDQISTDLANAWTDLEEAFEQYNLRVQEAFATLQAQITLYNNELSKARDFASEVAQETADYISEKSDKWQESDKGQEYQSFQEEYESLQLDDIELDEPAEIELVFCDNHSELLDQASEGA